MLSPLHNFKFTTISMIAFISSMNLVWSMANLKAISTRNRFPGSNNRFGTDCQAPWSRSSSFSSSYRGTTKKEVPQGYHSQYACSKTSYTRNDKPVQHIISTNFKVALFHIRYDININSFSI